MNVSARQSKVDFLHVAKFSIAVPVVSLGEDMKNRASTARAESGYMDVLPNARVKAIKLGTGQEIAKNLVVYRVDCRF